MVFSIDNLILMGALVASREGYIHYKRRKNNRSPTNSTTSILGPMKPAMALDLGLPAIRSDPKDTLCNHLRINEDESRVLRL